ncbi:uncharacterized protein LY89DRAFT_207164 [Mollisia scopiformis]|uniref:Uncharacterized protein n=1 Tax=Mollisia scopiformis TaxID=149040 RepID=A0A194WWQ5_MOLSC|nr:uncharacterized protein LY89DRAFT_207164 [Mollisia scopiformis]KUJ12411.1 hypothetical protein LY89DRAFT_207164 [Mollisia scopiformis]
MRRKCCINLGLTAFLIRECLITWLTNSITYALIAIAKKIFYGRVSAELKATSKPASVYTFKVPFIAKRPLVLSMVYHIRAEGNSFIAARNGPSTNREHMFCLIAGFKVSDMTQMITRILSRWQDISDDHSHSGAGLTPKLFLAIVISQYGFMNSKDVVKAGLSLKGKYDIQLQACLKSLWGLSPDSIQRIHEDTKNIRDLNKVLINMNSNLTGTRSIMHYLSATSEILIDRITAFETYVESRLNEWDENPCARDLVLGLRDMDSFKETLRDTDKLQIVRKSMQQYMVDIDALHEQIDINISMVGNLIAEKDRAIQIHMAEQGNRDGSNMKIMAGLTAAFLPVTFMAVLLTTPMFKWDAQPGESVVVKLPTKIYWSASLSLSTLFAICLAALWRHRTSEDDKRHVAVQDEGEYALKDQGVQTVGTSRGSTPKEPKPVVKERSPSILEKGIAPPRSVEL